MYNAFCKFNHRQADTPALVQVMSIVDGINGLDPEVLHLACTLTSLCSMCITAMSLNRPLKVTLINTTMT
jgi:hypothetical protein